jgi:hypothetical protein
MIYLLHDCTCAGTGAGGKIDALPQDGGRMSGTPDVKRA